MQKETALQKMIDVVEDVSFPHQNSEYQETFRAWRREKKNPYAFRFTKNPKESAFWESPAAAESPAQAEQKVLARLGTLIGYTLIGCLVIENLFDKAAVLLMQILHFRIELVFLGESHLYGDEKIVFWVSFLIHFLKYLLPGLLLQSVLHFPLPVSLPINLKNPFQLLPGIALTMLLSVSTGMFGISRSAELEKYRLISNAVNAEGKRIILYVLLMIFVLPIAAELFLHGCLFQVLRQFGDTFAIAATAILAAAMTHNAPDAIRIGLLHLTISYYLIQTGSFSSAVLLRIVHEIYMFVLFCMESFDSIYSLQWWIMVLVPCVLGTGTVIYILKTKKLSGEQTIPNQTYLNMQEKFTAFFTPMPMLAFLVCCVLLLVVTAMLT